MSKQVAAPLQRAISSIEKMLAAYAGEHVAEQRYRSVAAALQYGRAFDRKAENQFAVDQARTFVVGKKAH